MNYVLEQSSTREENGNYGGSIIFSDDMNNTVFYYNVGVEQKIDDYSDFSFLRKENFDSFIEKVKRLNYRKKKLIG